MAAGGEFESDVALEIIGHSKCSHHSSAVSDVLLPDLARDVSSPPQQFTMFSMSHNVTSKSAGDKVREIDLVSAGLLDCSPL